MEWRSGMGLYIKVKMNSIGNRREELIPIVAYVYTRVYLDNIQFT